MAVCSLALAVGTLAACESTQSKSARLGREGKTVLNQKGSPSPTGPRTSR